MKSCEMFVSPESEYYIYTPSRAAKEMFLYPLQCGHFIYEPGYFLRRTSYDSFLLMFVQKGRLTLELSGQTIQACADHFILLDCYRPHAYFSETGWQCLWCHFDGPAADKLYAGIVSRLGNVFSMPDPHLAQNRLRAVYQIFSSGVPVREPLLHKYLTDILTACLLQPAPPTGCGPACMSEEIMAYITEHFTEDISVETLAARAGLSPYHFIRTFKKETGFTPHEYLVGARISAAKYLLKNTRLSVKDICFRTGFSCESVFCSAFKRSMGVTPMQYRTETRSLPE